MTTLIYAEGLRDDVQRIVEHLALHEVPQIEQRVADIFDALHLLLKHPLIGRPAGPQDRELVIGQGSRGYVALYRYDPLDDAVIVLALRGQKEAGFRDR